ncbi:hypothetical protein F0342_01280 [Bacillus sp. CH30_1T]|uniref:CBO0543 family protein n=1 Tax=Bacillus sp. CH30_1T TaxID=2604836 RepID=UPI0011F07771|nr:CBO0543 family protein [Bacillus sp. CH30_1T]KAA0566711.1 hypothetical protein F0342_01280 [Bacillus sp. CH30_1T]
MSTEQKIHKIYETMHQTYIEKFELWREEIMFGWQWWIGVFLTIIPWILWAKYRPKESTHRLLYIAFFVMVIAIWLDSIGVQLGLWHYNYEVLPFSPSYKPWDITLIPVLTIVFIQIKPNVSFLKKGILYGFLVSFIAEPVFVWSDFVVYTGWKYIYSFPIYTGIYFISHYLSTRNHFGRIQKNRDY